MKSIHFSVKLFLRTNRSQKDGMAIIYARIRLGREKTELSTSKAIKPSHWDENKCAVINTTDANTINKHLEAFKSKINNAYSNLYIAQQEITLDAITSLVLGKPSTPTHTLLSVATEHNDHFKSMLGIKYSPGSYKNYKTTLIYLTEFIPAYYGKPDLSLGLVNYKFCESFFTYLTTKKKCHTNGANKQLQRLKKIINYAIKLGYIQANPIATYTLEFEPVNKVALTIPEIEMLRKLELQRLVLEQVRDVFLMQCYTGLSYGDIKLLAQKHLSVAENGIYWIHMVRQKTKVSFAIPLLQPALVLLQKYIPETKSELALFTVLSNQKMNDNLKLLQELASISNNLTTHLARHTFATTITLSNGVPIETVSRMLGHTKLSTTQVYAKVLDVKIGTDMLLLSEKLQMQELNKKKIATNDLRAAHIMMNAEQDGIVCSGAMSGKKLTYALIEERIAPAKVMSKQDGAALLAKRYFTSHGPATVHDFSWWSGMSLTEAKAALAANEDALDSEEIDGKTYWFGSHVQAAKAASTSFHFLPAYDEFLVSYKDRSGSLETAHTRNTITVNGIFRPVILVDGRVAGTWKRTIEKDTVIIETEYFNIPDDTGKGLRKALKQYGTYLGKDAVLAD